MDIDRDREKTALSLVVGMKMAMAQKKPTIRKLPASGLTESSSPSSLSLGVAANMNTSNGSKQAKISAGPRTRPPIVIEAPVGAFPVSGINVGVEKKESSLDLLPPPPPSPILPHKQPHGSAIPRQGSISQGVMPPSPLPPQPLRFSFATTPPTAAAEWRPTLSLDQIAPGSSPSTLKTREMFPRPDLSPVFYLEKNYTIRASLPRSFYIVMAQHGIRHSCVFEFPVGDKWWGDLSGMRKSAYIEFKAENSTVQWELHLKPSRDRTNIFGYICKHDDLANMINSQKFNLLKARRLPLVLDLDDTLVRLVGSERTRYVSETDAAKVPARVRKLRDGRQVVLTEYVEEFLEWASKLYEISVCSLGEQSYVDMVADVLDPMRTRIRGTRYSARQEYDYLNASPSTTAPAPAPGPLNNGTNGTATAAAATTTITNNINTNTIFNANGTNQPPAPPKDLLSLYAFCAMGKPSTDGLPEIGNGFTLPLIVDDLTQMWPPEQHDNVIVVKERKNSPVWTVNLFPMVQHVLGAVHQEFFRAYDSWDRARAAALASITITPGIETLSGENNSNMNGGSGGGAATGLAGLTAIDFTATTPAKTAFLSMTVPSTTGCYKEWLRGSLRDQISLTAAPPPPNLTAAITQQQQALIQQQQQLQQQQQQPQYQPMQQPPPITQ